MSVLPIVIIITLLNFTVTPLGGDLTVRFLLGSVFILIGLTLFLFGVDLAVHPLGMQLGRSITKTGKISWIGIFGFILGFFISAAEPDLHILAQEVSEVSGGLLGKFTIVGVVSIGIGALTSYGLIRIIKDWSIKTSFLVAYLAIGVLALFANNDFIAIAFDASGATTGSMSTPFILALAVGASFFKGSKLSNEEDSFGLVGLCSAGAIFVVLALGLLTGNKELSGQVSEEVVAATGFWGTLMFYLKSSMRDVFIGMAPLLAVYFLRKKSFGLNREEKRLFNLGFVYTYVGLVLFLLGVDLGFIEAGRTVGFLLASRNPYLTIVVGFFIGLVVLLAEPAVYTLTRQIEDITGGSIPRKTLLITLSLGIGGAVALSMVRILVPELQLWHFLLPGYLLVILMMRKISPLFVGIAFDSGGVASGPMTATFVLGFATGVAEAIPHADVLTDGFGIIATVAMMAVFALSLLGMVYQLKLRGGKTHEKS